MANPHPDTSGLRPPWKPGESGNPSGKPKSIRQVTDLARSRAEKALKVLEDVMNDDGATPASRVSAATILLERGYGKPSADVQLTVKRNANDFSDEELEAIADEGEDGGESAVECEEDGESRPD